MGLLDRLYDWRMARFAAAAIREIEREEAALRDGAVPDWAAWWEDRGRQELRCILMTAWDPIGVGDTVEAWDEYDSYLAGVAHRLRDARDEESAAASVAEQLAHIERSFMGETATERDLRWLAEQIVAWHEFSFAHDGRPPHEWLPD